MKKLDDFLNQHQAELRLIIDSLPNSFNSHDFIEKVAHEFEGEYIDYLNHYRGKGAFRTVHGQIARHLSVHASNFQVKKLSRAASETVFGTEDIIQEWQKF